MTAKKQEKKTEGGRISPALARLAVDVRFFHADRANVRRHEERNLAAIQASLTKFGQQAPVIFVRKGGKMVVIKGNGLLAAAKALGWKRLAAVESKLAGAEAKAYAIADNRTSDLSEFDGQLLAAQLEELEAADFDLSAVGFTEEEMAEMDKALENAGADDKERVEFDAAKRKRKLSDLYSVIVECKNEREQLTFYRRMQKEGRKCKLYVL